MKILAVDRGHLSNLSSLPPTKWQKILLIEDNSARSERQRIAGVAATNVSARVVVRLHQITSSGCKLVSELSYRTGALKNRGKRGGKAAAAFKLLDAARPRRRSTVIAAGPAYGCNSLFLAGLLERDLNFIVEVRPSTKLHGLLRGAKGTSQTSAANLLGAPKWKRLSLQVPGSSIALEYSAALLPKIRLPNEHHARLFAGQTGGILGIHRGTIFGIASESGAALSDLLRVVGWARWIRPVTRKQERQSRPLGVPLPPPRTDAKRVLDGTRLTVRSNIKDARRQDKRAQSDQFELPSALVPLRGELTSLSPVLNVAELFAGAGGMGLGFLLAGAQPNRYRLIFSGEVNPICVETLRVNHGVFSEQCPGDNIVPERVESLDLRTRDALSVARRSTREAGGVHILIGGPPCQGFSNANRNSWHSANPNNRLINVFLEYVEALRPPVFVLENVQGILWTPKRRGASGRLSVVTHLARRMASAGYEVFPKLLDAVWYGVPQYRSRFFVLGLRKDLGYRREDFGSWGPFPLPTHGPGRPWSYVTVRDAIGDLPRIGNGTKVEQQPYDEPRATDLLSNAFLKLMRASAPSGVIVDHVTSRHAEYVIDRYRRIPPGGNWENIAHTLTNYAAVQRTHSNIYRKLKWNESSITIGHYRKSMLVHPSQHRGLSLREASRLQSFPDWFRFSGGTNGAKTGLVHKQQQLANAVCPLVTKALAEFILRL